MQFYLEGGRTITLSTLIASCISTTLLFTIAALPIA